MVALLVPQKKCVESAVREIDVTDPITLASDLISMSLKPIFATLPSPAPTSKSPFASKLTQLIPYEKSLLTGPILLKRALSRAISIISPVLVPRKAN